MNLGLLTRGRGSTTMRAVKPMTDAMREGGGMLCRSLISSISISLRMSCSVDWKRISRLVPYGGANFGTPMAFLNPRPVA